LATYFFKKIISVPFLHFGSGSGALCQVRRFFRGGLIALHQVLTPKDGFSEAQKVKKNGGFTLDLLECTTSFGNFQWENDDL
jgi:hypothetical protein